ncbi:hypothetical protein [Fluviicola sp.]|uniref:hypothetical protein n=1 Tax=Fluviicola sp. TaxID=1917219 RepID=UPI0031D57689
MKKRKLLLLAITIVNLSLMNKGLSQENSIKIDINKINKDGYEVDFKKGFTIAFVNMDSKTENKIQYQVEGADGNPAKEITMLAEKLRTTKYELKILLKDDKLILTAADPTNPIEIDKNFFLIFNKDRIAIKNKFIESEQDKNSENNIIPYWQLVKKFEFKLSPFKVDPEKNGVIDETEILKDYPDANCLIYNAKTGKTKTYLNGKIVDKTKTVVNAGEPLVLVVANVNPAIYSVEVLDSTILMYNESNSLIETLLLSRAENWSGDNETVAQSKKINDEELKQYQTMKIKLLLARTEMKTLLENYYLSSPYGNECLKEKKKDALNYIDTSIERFFEDSGDKGSYKNLSFLQLVDLYLSPSGQDSVLNKELKILYKEFTINQPYITYYCPQVPKADKLDLRMTIEAKPLNPYPSLQKGSQFKKNSKNPTQTIYIKGFFKADISAGLYMGFKHDQTYTLAADSTITKNTTNTSDSTIYNKRIVNENTGTKEFGFASYLHLYHKCWTSVNLGLTLGAGISFSDKVRVRYFTGVSLLLGAHNRVCLSAGAVWGNYSNLSNQYKITKTIGQYDPLPSNYSKLEYVTRFRGTGFVSVSYNLPFLNRQSTGSKQTKKED